MHRRSAYLQPTGSADVLPPQPLLLRTHFLDFTCLPWDACANAHAQHRPTCLSAAFCAFPKMSVESRSQIIRSKRIGGGLDGFRSLFNALCEDAGIPASFEVLDQLGHEGSADWSYYCATSNACTETQDLAVALVSALLSLPASRHLPSCRDRKNLFDDLSRLLTAVNADDFNINRIHFLLKAVLHKEPDDVIWDAVYDTVTESTPPPRPILSFPQTPWLRNTSSFANSTEHRKYVDDVLKEELGSMYVGIPGFFEAFWGEVADLQPVAQAVFERCCEGDNPLY